MANMCRQHLFELDFFLSRDITFDCLLYSTITSIITTIHCSGGSGDEVVDSLSALCLHDACLADLEEHCSPPNCSPANVSSEEAEGEYELERDMSCLGDNMDRLQFFLHVQSHLQPLYRKELMRYVRDVEEEPNLDHGFARLCLAAEKRFCQRVPSSVQQILSHSDYDTVLNKGVTLNSLKLKNIVYITCLCGHRGRPPAKRHQELFGRDQMTMAESHSDFKLMSTCIGMIHSHRGDMFTSSSMDIKLSCSDELRVDSNKPFKHKNTVVRCLQSQYILTSTKQSRKSLTHSCSKYVREVSLFACGELLTSTTLNHHMDPLLALMCRGNLIKHCSENLALSGLDGRNNDGVPLEYLR
ncbi:hypothetical protein EGR_01742 [Echinococcus granulosus]|uniref:Uncharacterized protein n=1 Tax=Echinococcus granulosus TaxID=6210 RepID=W6URD1_ECHGR|nr:hypothetical protein EGR_01742 [Echinococcus granulosus]EUB63251.1 hypothetical protein EGR_01742 [Echinococcus granulosus]